MTMKPISEIILFGSSTSNQSIECKKFIDYYKIPASCVRLDTEESRQQAANGNLFQILSVPTLSVIYSDGNVQLFIGIEKIIMWLKSLLAYSQRQNPLIVQNPEEEPPIPKPSQVKKIKKKIIVEDDEEIEEDDETDEEDDNETEKKKVKTKKKKPKAKKIKKKILEDEEIEIIENDEEESDRPPPPSTKGLMVGIQSAKPSKKGMTSILKQAQQMQQERQKTLGYNDEVEEDEEDKIKTKSKKSKTKKTLKNKIK